MSDLSLARLFDLVVTVNGRFVVRATYTEVQQARMAWGEMRHTIGLNANDRASPIAVNRWLGVCNEIIDNHKLRKPLTRGAS